LGPQRANREGRAASAAGPPQGTGETPRGLVTWQARRCLR